MAVLNDSTGTLMSCAHKNLDCRIGVIIGKEEVELNFLSMKILSIFTLKISISWGNQSMIFAFCLFVAMIA